jgi:hypothetical protein
VAADVADLGSGEWTFCPECYRTLWVGGNCKRRDCPSYAGIYLRDQAERLRVNLVAWEGRTCLVTLTAPGADVLPWDRSACPEGGTRAPASSAAAFIGRLLPAGTRR